MEDEIKDVEAEGAETNDESSESESEKVIPYGRFKEIVDKKNELEAKLKELAPKEEVGPERQKQLEAEKFLKDLLKKTIKEEEEEKARIKTEQQTKFESDVAEQVSKNPGVKKGEFIKFFDENRDDFASVASAMKHYRTIMGISKEAAEKADKEKKPALPNTEAGASNKSSYDDKGKSLSQIAEEALRNRG